MTLNDNCSKKFRSAFDSNRLTIVARWREDQDFSMESPAEVKWGDGSAATLEAFENHRLDTHTFLDKGEWIEQHIFPDIVAEIYFDQTGFWRLRGRGVITQRMELTDPNAKDDEVIAELSTYNIVYRARILR